MLGGASQEYNAPLTPGRNALSSSCPINFQFDELKKEMDTFTELFDSWMLSKKKQIMQDKEKFSFAIAEDTENAEQLKNQLEFYSKKKQEIHETMEYERKEIKEAQLTNEELLKQKGLLELKKNNVLMNVQELTTRLNYELEGNLDLLIYSTEAETKTKGSQASKESA